MTTSFNKARGSQIRAGVITNSHISDLAAIDESKLAIDWLDHGNTILASKLLVDFVQVGKYTVATASSVVELVGGTISAATPADANEKKGPVVQDGKNRVILRNSVTGEPVLSENGKEVYAKLGHTGTAYTLSLFSTSLLGVEEVFTTTEEVVVDFQYPQRFDFLTVAESFASNEKFVDGSADISTRLDLNQIIHDAFGVSYSLTQDGQTVRAKSIVAELADQTSGLVNTGVRASTIIDEVVTARGASLDLNTRLTAIETSITDAEFLDALAAQVATNETTLTTVKTEVDTARGTALSLNDRLNDGDLLVTELENQMVAVKGRTTDSEAEIVTLKGRADNTDTSIASLDGRVTPLEVAAHKHFAEDHEVTVGDPLIDSTRYDLTVGTFTVGDKSLSVYINGMLQMVGVHYTEAPGGVAVIFAPEKLAVGDVVQLRWTNAI